MCVRCNSHYYRKIVIGDRKSKRFYEQLFLPQWYQIMMYYASILDDFEAEEAAWKLRIAKGRRHRYVGKNDEDMNNKKIRNMRRDDRRIMEKEYPELRIKMKGKKRK